MRHARALLTAILSGSLLASSAASAASSAPPPPAAEPNAWLALSMLTPTGAAALGTAGVAAGQAEAPLPPPPPSRDPNDTTWMLIGSSVILLALLAWAVSKGDREHDEVATSPF